MQCCSISSLPFSKRVLGFAVLALLASGLVLAPHRLAAQQAAPAVQSSAPVAPSEAATPASAPAAEKAKPTDQDDNNVYRHSKTVQSLARMFNLPVETTARIFEFINFGIVFFAIAIPLGRMLPRIFRKRAQTVRFNIDSARKVTEDANARLSAVEAKMASLDEEIAKFRAEVEAESKQDEARIKSTLKDESDRIVSAAEQEIEVAASQARRTLCHFAADLAIEQAGKQLVLTPEADRALIAQFVSDLGINGSAKGGQN